jgi:glycosyltransferase involved in cell wall biosynthesis
MIPLVSIVVPAYNAERWIMGAIESCLVQTWAKKEIVIVDDGSKDNTLGVARRYESKLVKVLTQENKGAAAARNRGLAVAQGDYIQWLDADDLLHPDKISQQLKKREKLNDSRILYSSAFGKFYYDAQKAKVVENSLSQDLLPVEWLLNRFTTNSWMAISAWLISRQISETAGIWNEQLSLDDDGEYSCRIVAASERVVFVREAKSYYRQANLKSVSRSTSERACKSLLISSICCIEYLRLLEDSERTKTAGLRLLNRWLYHFYPENPSIYPAKDKWLYKYLDIINQISWELGSSLKNIDMNWKYVVTKKLFGRKAAMRIRNYMSSAKMIANKHYELWFI